MQYTGGGALSNSYSHSLTSVLYSARPLNCNLTRLSEMLKATLGNQTTSTENARTAARLMEALRLNESHYHENLMTVVILRFVVSAIQGLVEQNTAYPTEYPMPIKRGWPLVGLCQLLNEQPYAPGYSSISVEYGSESSNATLDNYYIQELLPRVVGLYFNTTGQTTEYCVEQLGAGEWSSTSGILARAAQLHV